MVENVPVRNGIEVDTVLLLIIEEVVVGGRSDVEILVEVLVVREKLVVLLADIVIELELPVEDVEVDIDEFVMIENVPVRRGVEVVSVVKVVVVG